MEHFEDEIEDQQEEDPDREQRKTIEGLLNKLKQHLYQYYEPAQTIQDADFHYSTQEIWQQMLRIYPNEIILTAELIAVWLHSGGFTFLDFGNMKFEWLLKRANQ
jgi:hypothetical protein